MLSSTVPSWGLVRIQFGPPKWSYTGTYWNQRLILDSDWMASGVAPRTQNECQKSRLAVHSRVGHSRTAGGPLEIAASRTTVQAVAGYSMSGPWVRKRSCLQKWSQFRLRLRPKDHRTSHRFLFRGRTNPRKTSTNKDQGPFKQT